MKIRGLFIVLSLLAVLIGSLQPASVLAAEAISGFHGVTLWLYPEYDDPRLLVMLEGKVNANEAPSQISFLVPQTAEMNSAGSMDAQGNYTGGPPERVASQIAGWDQISYQLKSDTFRVEYYDNIIAGTTDKKISYDFRWLYPVTDLTVRVQQPLKASNFTVVPAGQIGTEGQFRIYGYEYSNPDINQPLHFDVSYTKSDPNPSLGGTGTSTSTNGPRDLTLIVIAAMALIAVVVLFIVNRSKKRRPVKVAELRPRTTNKTTTLGDRYCDQCGRPVGKGYKFCPHCGNNLSS